METQEAPKSEPIEQPNLIDANDLVVAIKRSPEGLMIMLKPRTRGELVQAYGELQIAITSEVIKFNDMMKRGKSEHKGIIQMARERWRK